MKHPSRFLGRLLLNPKEKNENVSSSSEYSINHQDPKSRFIEEEQDSINHQEPKG
jgi:hypothetical protein